MISGARVNLRPITDQDWGILEAWGQRREGLWGPYQRFQLDHLPLLRDAYRQPGLLKRELGFLLIELRDDHRVIGFVRYTLVGFPDADFPYPEIGYGIGELDMRGKGYAREAVSLLVDYLFAGYAAPRIAAITDVDNVAAQRLLEKLHFQREGILRQATFRDGRWCDFAIYSILRTATAQRWP